MILHAFSGGLGMYFSRGLLCRLGTRKMLLSVLEIVREFKDFNTFCEIFDLEAELCDLLLIGLKSDEKFKIQYKDSESKKFVTEVTLANDVSGLMKVCSDDALLLPNHIPSSQLPSEDNRFLSIWYQGFPILDFYQ